MIEIRITNMADWDAFREKLDDLDELGNQIGVTMKAESEKAFEDQGFGDEPWPYRYQDSAWDSDPFVNVAGAVADLSNGPRISENNFQRRPALKHTGELRDSLTFVTHEKEGGIEVEVGTVKHYAEVSQVGGVTSQPLTDAFKRNLNEFLEKNQVREKLAPLKKVKKSREDEEKVQALKSLLREIRGKIVEGEATASDKEEAKMFRAELKEINQKYVPSGPREKITTGTDYASKLEHLLRKDELKTEHWARPFVGFSEQTRTDVEKLIAEFFEDV